MSRQSKTGGNKLILYVPLALGRVATVFGFPMDAVSLCLYLANQWACRAIDRQEKSLQKENKLSPSCGGSRHLEPSEHDQDVQLQVPRCAPGPLLPPDIVLDMLPASLHSATSQAVHISRITFGVLGLPTHRHVETMLSDPAKMHRIRCRDRKKLGKRQLTGRPRRLSQGHPLTLAKHLTNAQA